MPQTIEARRTTPGIRKSIRKGNNKERQGRKECNRTEAVASKVIASSLFALKPMPMVGIQVIEKQSPIFHTSSCGEEDFYKMYCDLLEALQYAIYEIKGEKTTFDPYKSGLDFATSFTYVLNLLENNILPKNFDFNIDKDKDGYYFTLYSECKFDLVWHPFEIKPMVEYLIEKGNEDLLTIFYTVINTLIEEIDMWTWYNGGMGYAECMVDDCMLDDRYDLDDEDEYLEHKFSCELLESYKNGYIYSIGKKIMESGIENAQSLKGQLDSFDQNNEVVKWMYKALDFIVDTPGNIRDYVYFQEEEDIEMGLTFMQMVTLIWDWDDIYTQYEMKSMDSEANNVGVSEPTYSFIIRKGCDMENYNSREEKKLWPMQLHQLWESHREALELINKEGLETIKNNFNDEY